jgi:hypothetical protein
VLHDQDYRTSQGAVIDGYGAMVEWRLARGIRRNSETNYNWRRVQFMKFLIMQSPLALRSQIFSPAPCYQIPSLNVRDQVPHPNKTTGKIIDFCITMFENMR